MPAVKKTDKLKLNQWQANEYPKMADFNSDNALIDKAYKLLEQKVDDMRYIKSIRIEGTTIIATDDKGQTTQVVIPEGVTEWEELRNKPLLFDTTWDKVKNKPATFTATPHNHDDRYYTKVEADNQYFPKNKVETNPTDGRIAVFKADGSIKQHTSRKVEDLATNSSLNLHTGSKIMSSSGVHGVRYHNNNLEYYDTKTRQWMDVETAGRGLAPDNVTNMRMKVKNSKVKLSWTDPEDTIVEGQLLCTWKGTKVVQKVGSFPENWRDGTLVVDNQERNKYQADGFEVGNLVNDRTYYFAFFPYSDRKAYNIDKANRLSGVPKAYREMTVKIDMNNSNPDTCVTYHDDAVGMTPGSDKWDDFFGHYPCMLKDGVEGKKLKKNDFSTATDNTKPDTTMGADGDVMICFPARGLKISTAGNIVTVTLTEAPDDDSFTYYAHTKNGERKPKMYLSAYLMSKKSVTDYDVKWPNYRSLRKTKLNQGQIEEWNRNVPKNTSLPTYYTYVYLISLLILKYKSLNVAKKFGIKYRDSNYYGFNGDYTFDKGMDVIAKGENYPPKLLGLEGFGGFNNVQGEGFLGMYTDGTGKIFTNTDAVFYTDDTKKQFKDIGSWGSMTAGLYINKVQATSEIGFMPMEAKGSSTTYFVSQHTFGNASTKASNGFYVIGHGFISFSTKGKHNGHYYEKFCTARFMYL